MSLWWYGWSSFFGTKRTIHAFRTSQRSLAYEKPYGPKLYVSVYGYASDFVFIGAITVFSPRHFLSYCGGIPEKLRRSSMVKSVPCTESVRCAEEMRRTRRRSG